MLTGPGEQAAGRCTGPPGQGWQVWRRQEHSTGTPLSSQGEGSKVLTGAEEPESEGHREGHESRQAAGVVEMQSGGEVSQRELK